MTIKQLSYYLCFFIILSCNKTEKESLVLNLIEKDRVFNPFLTLKYDKVIAYDYEGIGDSSNGGLIVSENGRFHESIKKTTELTSLQIHNFVNYIGDKSTYGNTTAFCFEPHLGIVFYKNKKIVAHLSICLDCNYLISSIEIPATSYKKIKIGDDYEYDAEGFSKLGRKQLNQLCNELNFSHCSDLNSTFDK